MAKSKPSTRSSHIQITVHKNLVYLFFGFAALLLMWTFYSRFYYVPALTVASADEISAAAKEIELQGIKAKSTSCINDSREASNRAATYDSYIRVNQYANRAVIRGCNDIDALLMKDYRGVWLETGVNVALDARANPAWQKACLIDDITTADDVVRPENRSIDQMNLEACQYMRKYNKVKPLP